MRPDLSDLIAGVQRLLQGEITPALGDPFLREQAMYGVVLLEYCKKAWPREHLAVGEEHDDLGATLSEVAARLPELASDEARSLADALRAELGRDAGGPAARPLDELLAADRERRAGLERAIALLDRVEAHGTLPPAHAALRATIDAYLARTAARAMAAVQTLGIGW